LRPYQNEIAKAILDRALRRRGGSISVEIARQGGKNELSARVELVLLLARERSGGTVIKCAPTLVPQAALSCARLRERIADAGLDGHMQVSGNAVRNGGAEVRFLSAEAHANVVGHTASLLLEVDEAQDVDAETFDRAFRPMAASTNAPVVYYGTPWSERSLLAQATAMHLEAERADGVRRHFRFDWEQVAAQVPAYRAYVEAERARLGERHPLFRTQYLLETLGDAGRLFDGAALAQLEGTHERLSAPRAGERYVAGLDVAGVADPQAEHAGRDRDWTVLTIARVRPHSPAPSPRSGRGGDGLSEEEPEVGSGGWIEVVEHQAWQGEATEPLVAALADRLRRVWRVRRLAVDATGLGGPVAELLAARLGVGVVERVVFTTERKSRLGFALLSAVHSGRLRLYRMDGSTQWAECRRQLERARVAYRAKPPSTGRAMQFYVDPAEGHDDYLMSLALCVSAAGHAGGDRTARGRVAPALPEPLLALQSSATRTGRVFA
jgi:hypothetical protein